MNPRIRYSQKYDRLVNLIDGAEFQFIPNNPESKAKALEALDAHATKVIAAIETHAGRPLTDTELLRGVDHVETRTKSEQIADAMPDPQPRDADVGNPFQYAIDRGWDKDARKESKAQAYKRKAAEWEIKKQAETDQAAFDADPKRQKAIAHAKRELDALRFDPSATAAEIEQAENRLHVAKTAANVASYTALDKEWRQQKQSKIDEQTRTVDEQIALLRTRRAEIENRSFDPPVAPAPMPAAPSAPIVRMTQAELDEMMRPTREANAIRAEQAKQIFPAR
jgi:hypothetical protein